MAKTKDDDKILSLLANIDGVALPLQTHRRGDPPAAKTPSCVPAAGHSTISELELVAFVTPDQKLLAEVAKALASDPSHRVDITVTERLKARKQLRVSTYRRCLLTGLDFAAMDRNVYGHATERATFQPESVDVELRPLKK